MATHPPDHKTDGQSRLYVLVLFLLAGPFYLNDFANLYVSQWQWWLGIDYLGLKLFPVLLIFWLIRTGRMQAGEFGLKRSPALSFTGAFLVLTIAGTLIDQNAYTLISTLPGYPPLWGMPAIESTAWDWIDLTFGLLMVGVCEELVFRGFMHTVLTRKTKNPYVIVSVSAVAFGLIHWSLGLHSVIITGVIGALFMAVYMRTRSLPALMLAHFAINFIDFSGVVPKSIFRLTL